MNRQVLDFDWNVFQMKNNISREKDIKREIFSWNRRLQALKEKKAKLGITADPSLDMEIEEIGITLEQLLLGLENLTSSQTSDEVQIPYSANPPISADNVFRLRTQIPDFTQLLGRHNEIWMVGKDLFGFTTRFRHQIETASKSGKRFRFLFVNPTQSHLLQTITASSITHPKEKKRHDIAQIALDHFREIESVAPEAVEIKLANFLPVCSYQILDGRESRGEMIVEFYGYKISESERLHIHLTRAIDKEVFEFHFRQFEAMWRCRDNQRLSDS